MTFKELQQRVFELVLDENSSVASYLNLHKEYSSKALTPPEYFRKARVAFLSNFTIQGLPEVFKTRAIFHNLWVDTYLGSYNQYAQEILNPDGGLYKFKPTLIYFLTDGVDAAISQDLLAFLKKNSDAQLAIYSGNFNVSQLMKDLGDFRVSPADFPNWAEDLMKDAVAASGATKKCLVLDLDDTVWSGIVGEDGSDKVVPNEKVQKKALELYKSGIILAINSRNNPEEALAVIDKHPQMVLRQNHFAAQRINWQDKAQNIKELAEELMLGTESFVFVDDDLYNLNMVKAQFPEVAALTPQMLEKYAGFHSLYLTEEDKKRGQMYAEEFTRRQLKSKLGSVEDFLKELNLEVIISPVTEKSLTRVAQLTHKTNQFNLTTRRYTEEQLKEFLAKGWKLQTVSAIDRFGDYGVVGAQMIEPGSGAWRIDNFLLSCRILGRGIEKSFLAHALEQAKNAGVKEVLAEFIPTAKNKMAEKFYPENGFEVLKEDGERRDYKYNLISGLPAYPKFIKVTIA